jgi:hypothetical protein
MVDLCSHSPIRLHRDNLIFLTFSSPLGLIQYPEDGNTRFLPTVRAYTWTRTAPLSKRQESYYLINRITMNELFMVESMLWSCILNSIELTLKLNSVAFSPQANYTERPPLVGEVRANFLRIEGVAWSAQRIPTAVNLGFVDRSRYFSIQVAPQLSSRGWVDPVPDPLLLRKSASAGNRTRDLWICSQELWPLAHRGGLELTQNDFIQIAIIYFESIPDSNSRLWGKTYGPHDERTRSTKILRKLYVNAHTDLCNFNKVSPI